MKTISLNYELVDKTICLLSRLPASILESNSAITFRKHARVSLVNARTLVALLLRIFCINFFRSQLSCADRQPPISSNPPYQPAATSQRLRSPYQTSWGLLSSRRLHIRRSSPCHKSSSTQFSTTARRRISMSFG